MHICAPISVLAPAMSGAHASPQHPPVAHNFPPSPDKMLRSEPIISGEETNLTRAFLSLRKMHKTAAFVTHLLSLSVPGALHAVHTDTILVMPGQGGNKHRPVMLRAALVPARIKGIQQTGGEYEHSGRGEGLVDRDPHRDAFCTPSSRTVRDPAPDYPSKFAVNRREQPLDAWPHLRCLGTQNPVSLSARLPAACAAAASRCRAA